MHQANAYAAENGGADTALVYYELGFLDYGKDVRVGIDVATRYPWLSGGVSFIFGEGSSRLTVEEARYIKSSSNAWVNDNAYEKQHASLQEDFLAAGLSVHLKAIRPLNNRWYLAVQFEHTMKQYWIRKRTAEYSEGFRNYFVNDWVNSFGDVRPHLDLFLGFRF